MPCLVDWVNSPLSIVDSIFEKHKDGDWKAEIAKYFQDKLKDESVWGQIPLLNSVPSHALRDNQMARFRCMVQDMFDPEFFLGKFEVKDNKTGQSVVRTGRYKDLADCNIHEEILYDSDKSVNDDRQTLYCISVPGENEWVQEAYSSMVRLEHASDAMMEESPNAKRKHCAEDEAAAPIPDVSALQISPEGKRVRPEEEGNRPEAGEGASSASTVTKATDLSFPIPDPKGQACLVKVYDSDGKFSLNDVIEFVGIVSVHPCLAEEGDGDSEGAAHSPPPSLVPRLHVVAHRKVPYSNPHLAPATLDEMEVTEVRSKLLNILITCLSGDTVAAEYLLCHLISSLYLRKDATLLGKFCVNLSNVPAGFGLKLYKLLQMLLPKSYYLPLSLENLNKLNFCPRKDYISNKLISGVLQISSHTQLVLDETAMSVGHLDAKGVQNITALTNLINWQKVDYDFDFHKIEYECDIPVLVLSECRSLLPGDVQVPWRPVDATLDAPQPEQMESLEKQFQEATRQLERDTSLLVNIRRLLGMARTADYSLSDEIQTVVEEDFVEIRQSDPEKMNVWALHHHLVFARLLSLSRGEKTLSLETWQEAKKLERDRKSRLSSPTTTTTSRQ